MVMAAQTRTDERAAICQYLAGRKGQVVDDALIHAIQDRAHLGKTRKPGERNIRRKLNRYHGESLESLIEAKTLREFLDLVQRIFLVHKMTVHGGNVTRAAIELDVDRRTLVALLARLGVR